MIIQNILKIRLRIGEEKMAPSELAYYELYGMAEEANEGIKNLKSEILQISQELHGVSDEILNPHRRPDMEYFKLAARVRCTSKDLADFKRHWNELTQQLEAVRFKLFLAEAHALMHTKNSKTRSERHSQWQKRYKHY